MTDSSTLRKIIHIDMDCFYAAVEMRERPELAGRPIAVGELRAAPDYSPEDLPPVHRSSPSKNPLDEVVFDGGTQGALSLILFGDRLVLQIATRKSFVWTKKLRGI